MGSVAKRLIRGKTAATNVFGFTAYGDGIGFVAFASDKSCHKFLLSKKCTNVRTICFLSRSPLLASVVSDKRDFPGYERDHPYRSIVRCRPIRHG